MQQIDVFLSTARRELCEEQPSQIRALLSRLAKSTAQTQQQHQSFRKNQSRQSPGVGEAHGATTSSSDEVFSLLFGVVLARTHQLFSEGIALLQISETAVVAAAPSFDPSLTSSCSDIELLLGSFYQCSDDPLQRDEQQEFLSRRRKDLAEFLCALLRDVAMKEVLLRHWQLDLQHIAADTMRIYSHALLARPFFKQQKK